MMTVDVRSRVEKELKQDAVAILKGTGIDLSTAIRLFLRTIVETGGMPIAIPRPNAATVQAIKDAKAGKTTKVAYEDF